MFCVECLVNVLLVLEAPYVCTSVRVQEFLGRTAIRTYGIPIPVIPVIIPVGGRNRNRNPGIPGIPGRNLQRRSRMPLTTWKSLSEETQSIWDSIDEAEKAKILAASRNDSKKPRRQVKLARGGILTPSKMGVNLPYLVNTPITLPFCVAIIVLKEMSGGNMAQYS